MATDGVVGTAGAWVAGDRELGGSSGCGGNYGRASLARLIATVMLSYNVGEVGFSAVNEEEFPVIR